MLSAPFLSRTPSIASARRELETVTIPSRSSEADYGRSDFFAGMAFRGACKAHGIPLDKPIPVAAFRLASEAFNVDCQHGRSGESEAWELARAALVVRRAA